MQKRLAIVCWVACLLALSGVPAWGNLLVNAGFEDVIDVGFGSGWDARGSSRIERVDTPVRSGARAARSHTREQGAWNGLRQVLPDSIEAGADYEAAAWIRIRDRTAADESDTVLLQLITETSDGTTNYENWASAFVAEGEWTRIEGTQTITHGDAVEVALSIHGPTTGVEFYVDDAVFQKAAVTPAVGRGESGGGRFRPPQPGCGWGGRGVASGRARFYREFSAGSGYGAAPGGVLGGGGK